MKLKELQDRAAKFACDASTTTHDSETMMQLSMRLTLAAKVIEAEHVQSSVTPELCKCGRFLAMCTMYKTLRDIEGSE